MTELLSGELYKAAGFRGKSLRIRFFRFYPGTIAFYKNKESSKALGFFPLKGLKLNSGLKRHWKGIGLYGLSLTDSDKKTSILYSDDEETIEQWVGIIKKQLLGDGNLARESIAQLSFKRRRLRAFTSKYGSALKLNAGMLTDLNITRSNDTLMYDFKVAGSNIDYSPTARFGVPIELAAERDESDIPLVVSKSIELVRSRGLLDVGIFRLSGSQSDVEKYKTTYDKDNGLDFSQETNVHNATGLLKLYFRECPEPVTTNELNYDFIEAAKKYGKDDEKLAEVLKILVKDLPKPHYLIFQETCQLLYEVAENALTNKMGVNNLALLLGPTMVATREQKEGFDDLRDMKSQCKIISTLIQYKDFVFFDKDPSEIVILPVKGKKSESLEGLSSSKIDLLSPFVDENLEENSVSNPKEISSLQTEAISNVESIIKIMEAQIFQAVAINRSELPYLEFNVDDVIAISKEINSEMYEGTVIASSQGWIPEIVVSGRFLKSNCVMLDPSEYLTPGQLVTHEI